MLGRFGSPVLFRFTLDLASVKEVTNRWDGEAESQWIVAARLLYHLQYLVPYLSRLQRIHLPDRLKLNAKRPTPVCFAGAGELSTHASGDAYAPLLVVG